MTDTVHITFVCRRQADAPTGRQWAAWVADGQGNAAYGATPYEAEEGDEE